MRSHRESHKAARPYRCRICGGIVAPSKRAFHLEARHFALKVTPADLATSFSELPAVGREDT